jgi:LacI family transcriptional regulator
MEPALTTVRQPFYEMGRRASEILLTLVDAPLPVNGLDRNGRVSEVPSSIFSESIGIKMPTSLIVRASCGASHRTTIE